MFDECATSLEIFRIGLARLFTESASGLPPQPPKPKPSAGEASDEFGALCELCRLPSSHKTRPSSSDGDGETSDHAFEADRKRFPPRCFRPPYADWRFVDIGRLARGIVRSTTDIDEVESDRKYPSPAAHSGTLPLGVACPYSTQPINQCGVGCLSILSVCAHATREFNMPWTNVILIPRPSKCRPFNLLLSLGSLLGEWLKIPSASSDYVKWKAVELKQTNCAEGLLNPSYKASFRSSAAFRLARPDPIFTSCLFKKSRATTFFLFERMPSISFW